MRTHGFVMTNILISTAEAYLASPSFSRLGETWPFLWCILLVLKPIADHKQQPHVQMCHQLTSAPSPFARWLHARNWSTQWRINHWVWCMYSVSEYRSLRKGPIIASFMGPTWGPSRADRTQVGPMLAPWTLLSGGWCLEQYLFLNARNFPDR